MFSDISQFRLERYQRYIISIIMFQNGKEIRVRVYGKYDILDPCNEIRENCGCDCGCSTTYCSDF